MILSLAAGHCPGERKQEVVGMVNAADTPCAGMKPSDLFEQKTNDKFVLKTNRELRKMLRRTRKAAVKTDGLSCYR